jgi:hypothetical protein
VVVPDAGTRLSRFLRAAVVAAALVVVFAWLLPKFIDVWDALTELSAWEVLVLLGLCLARVPTEALMYRAFLRGLSLRRGSEAYLSSNFAGSSCHLAPRHVRRCARRLPLPPR